MFLTCACDRVKPSVLFNNTPITAENVGNLTNVFSTGNISGETAGGIIGSAWWNNANNNKFENCYFLKSDTVEKSSGKNIVVDAKMLEKLANTEIEEINNYIENNEDNIDTSLWKKWKLGENGYPVFK